MGEYGPLSPVIVRALLDKGYDKRKNAGYEVERIVKDFIQKDDFSQVKNIIAVLSDFIISPNVHYKKGGLIGLASAALGLGPKAIDPFLGDLVTPIFPCFNNQNPNVRYYATEALCNVCRVAKSSILTMFKDIFCVIIQLSFEVDQNMRNATELLDRVMKDIVTESPRFDLVSFIPILREKCLLKDAPYHSQMMLVSWISTLQSVPDIDLMPFLPQIIDGIFLILESPKVDVKKMAEVVIGQFMASMEKKPESVNFIQIINILIVHAQSQDPLAQKTSQRMILIFIQLSKRAMLPYLSGILRASLPCLAYEDSSLLATKMLAEDINIKLMGLIGPEDDFPQDELPTKIGGSVGEAGSKGAKIDMESVMEVLQLQLTNKHIPCKTVVLKWLYLLNEKTPAMMQRYVDEMLQCLLRTVCDSSDEVVLLALQVLAQIASAKFSSSGADNLKHEKVNGVEKEGMEVGFHFHQILRSLLHLFDMERTILKSRGSFIVRQLCVMLPASEIYCVLSELLQKEVNLSFATVMVEVLSHILLTSKELYCLRKKLRCLETEEACDLFVKLFGCWCHSPVATLTLCLLSQCYDQAATLVHIIGDLDVTTDTLVELDKLIQMIESPIFSSLRLQLLRPSENTSLVETLYGILMLIPQTDAFQMLRCRLNCVPPSTIAASEKARSQCKKRNFYREIDFDDLISHFVATQRRHQEFREKTVKERLQSTIFNASFQV